MCGHNFVIIDCDRMYCDRFKGKRHRRAHHLRGVGALVGIQTFINISVATGIFPNTGISLPFVSYGLTSLVCFFAGIGLVLNVGLQPKNINRGDESV